MGKELLKLEQKIENTMVDIPLKMIIETMKVLELAQNFIGEGEQYYLIGEYANTLLHEILAYISSDDLEWLEDNQVV